MRYLGILAILAALLVSCTSAPAAEAPTTVPVSTSTPAPTVPPTVTSTEAPTAPPKPTDTPAPTATPEPTTTPTSVPSPTPPPQPVVLKGKGQSVTDPFTLPSPISKLVFQHDGARNFIVTAYKADGSNDILVNAIGRYRGIRPLSADGKVYLEIKADGPWQVVAMPLGVNDSFANGFTGQGDDVSDLFTPTTVGPVPFVFTHDGERNFIVHLYCAGGEDTVQNEIGKVDGAAVVTFADGPCFWEVQADGKWTMKPK